MESKEKYDGTTLLHFKTCFTVLFELEISLQDAQVVDICH